MKGRQPSAPGGVKLAPLDYAASALVFDYMAKFLDDTGTRVSAIVLHGELNTAQRKDVAAVLASVDVMKSECRKQSSALAREARAQSEN